MIRCWEFLSLKVFADEAPDEGALLVPSVTAVGIEPVQLLGAEDDRDL
jgi:hypothetical protein